MTLYLKEHQNKLKILNLNTLNSDIWIKTLDKPQVTITPSY